MFIKKKKKKKSISTYASLFHLGELDLLVWRGLQLPLLLLGWTAVRQAKDTWRDFNPEESAYVVKNNVVGAVGCCHFCLEKGFKMPKCSLLFSFFLVFSLNC